jgi:hypothetical protein
MPGNEVPERRSVTKIPLDKTMQETCTDIHISYPKITCLDVWLMLISISAKYPVQSTHDFVFIRTIHIITSSGCQPPGAPSACTAPAGC